MEPGGLSCATCTQVPLSLVHIQQERKGTMIGKTATGYKWHKVWKNGGMYVTYCGNDRITTMKSATMNILQRATINTMWQLCGHCRP